jgi:hypothetical protein
MQECRGLIDQCRGLIDQCKNAGMHQCRNAKCGAGERAAGPIYELDSGRSKLFDLETDPNERVNLADRHAEQTRAYAKDLRQWSAVQKHLLQAAR